MNINIVLLIFLTTITLMHLRDIPHLPIEISRKEFVKIVFDVGLIHTHGYDTIIAAVDIGDRFVEYSGSRESYTRKHKYNSDYDKILSLPIEQIYSKELAYIVTVIAAKSNEDDGYNDTVEAVDDLCNYYLYKMEWEICTLFNYHFPVNNFITYIGTMLYATTMGSIKLSSVFWDISREYCFDRKLMKINSPTVLIGMMYLYRKNKLKAIISHKERLFRDTITSIAKECEVTTDEVIKIYISKIK